MANSVFVRIGGLQREIRVFAPYLSTVRIQIQKGMRNHPKFNNCQLGKPKRFRQNRERLKQV